MSARERSRSYTMSETSPQPSPAVVDIAPVLPGAGSLLGSLTFPAYRHLLDLAPTRRHLDDTTQPTIQPIAKEQTTALMSAAKANALASRIAFYNEQIAELTEWLNIVRNSITSARDQIPAKEADLKELKMQRDHCAWWLDRQSDALV